MRNSALTVPCDATARMGSFAQAGNCSATSALTVPICTVSWSGCITTGPSIHHADTEPHLHFRNSLWLNAADSGSNARRTLPNGPSRRERVGADHPKDQAASNGFRK